jgi:hypothetical protein
MIYQKTALIVILFIVITITAPLCLTSADIKTAEYAIIIDVCHDASLLVTNPLDVSAILDGQFYQREKPLVTKLIQVDIKDREYIIEFIIEHPPQRETS